MKLVRKLARVGFLTSTLAVVLLVLLQVYYAGYAVLVRPGDWSSHVQLGHMVSLPMMVMLPLLLFARMPNSYFLLPFGLYGLYSLQYVFLHAAVGDVAFLRAFHAMNSLALFLAAWVVTVRSWRRIRSDFRNRAVAGTLVVILAIGGLGVLKQYSESTLSGALEQVESLSIATEDDVPLSYRTAENPYTLDDWVTIANGRRLAEQRCAACHGDNLTGQSLGTFYASNLHQSARERSEQFLMWAISKGSRYGMPGWESTLTNDERWQIITFLKAMNRN